MRLRQEDAAQFCVGVFLQGCLNARQHAVSLSDVGIPTVEKFREQDQKIQAIEATLKEVQQCQAIIRKDNQQLRQDVQVEVSAARPAVSPRLYIFTDGSAHNSIVVAPRHD